MFGGLQMDEVAFPIVLAWQLGRTGAADWQHVRASADFLVARGPRTDQERWENIGGYSPATIASLRWRSAASPSPSAVASRARTAS